jgi:hypothetical protein
VLDGAAKAALAELLVRDDTLSELAALKQDAKDFGWRQMARGTGEARPARTAVPDRQGVAAQIGDLTTEFAQLTRAQANFYTVHAPRAASSLSRRICTCCVMPGCATGNSPTTSSTPWATI